MSYDLHIWSVNAFDPGRLRAITSWQRSGEGSCYLPHKNGQIVINSSDKVLADDVPEDIVTLLPGIAYLTELNLEGSASATHMQRLRATAKEIARTAHGVVHDPQDDAIITPTGVKRFAAPKRDQKFSVLSISWWFLTDALTARPGIEKVVSLLERRLPEALPKRYGEYEPPQHKFAETGRAHLLEYMVDHAHDLLVWYPNRPVTSFHLACPEHLGASNQGFRSNHLEIQIESSVLQQSGWKENLELFWRSMTHLLRPFYGEIRTIGNQVWMGATTGVLAADIEEGYPFTTRGWFWRGIPRKLGHAIVLGAEYQKQWPELLPQTQIENGFAFASTADWSSSEDLVAQVGAVPERIALIPGEGMGRNQKYPEVWPFGQIFPSPRAAQAGP